MSQVSLIVLVAGNKAKASEVNTNLNSLNGKFGTLVDSDIAPAANIAGSKISNSPGNRLTNANFENSSVDARVLKQDTSAGAPAGAITVAAAPFIIAAGALTGGAGGGGMLASNTIVTTNLKLITATFNLSGNAVGSSPPTIFCALDGDTGGGVIAPTSTTGSFSVGNYVVLDAEVRFPGVPTGGGGRAQVGCQVYKDSNTLHYWVVCYAIGGGSITAPSGTFVVVTALATV